MRRWLGNRVVAGRSVKRSAVKPRLAVQNLEARDVPAAYTVNSAADTNTGSGTSGTLRYVLGQITASADTGNTVTFNSTFATPQTITLTAALPTINKNVVVTGPGAASLTVSGGSAYRVFTVTDGTTTVLNVSLSGLTVADGSATGSTSTTGSGGGLYNVGESVTVTNAVFNNNLGAASLTSAGGGAVFQSGGTLTINSSTFTNNTRSSATTFVGGAIAAQGGTVTINSSSLSANTASYGGAIYTAATSLTITNSTLTANTGLSSSTGGGAIYISSGTVSIAGSSLSSNTTAYRGGAIYDARSSGSLTLDSTTFDANTASSYAGAIYFSSSIGAASIKSSTFSGNTAAGMGGAIYFNSSGSATISESTFYGNTANATSGGGGAISFFGTAATIRNSTFTANTSTFDGGGIRLAGSGTLAIISSIVAGNSKGSGTSNVGVDITYVSGTITPTNSVIGVANDFTYTASTTNVTGTVASPLDAKFDPAGLAFNGATTTKTVAILAGSPAINKGANPNNDLYDQRGVGFPRVLLGAADAGAYEFFSAIPYVSAVSATRLSAAAGSYTFTVTYGDNNQLNAATLQGNTSAVTVTGPSGAVPVTAAVIDTNTNGTPRTVTYTVTPAGGFTAASNGTYTIAVNGSQVYDTDTPTPNAIPAGAVGTFGVALPLSLVVTNTLDNGTGSFRDAVAKANANAGATDTITFQAGLTGTVALSGVVTISDSIVVNATGATVTLDGGAAVQVLRVDDGTATAITAAITNLTLQNGSVTTGTGGAGLFVNGESVSLTNVTVRNNKSTVAGGGVYLAAGSSLTLTSSTVSNNTSSATGGGIYAPGTVTVTLTGSAVQGNSGSSGGGIYHSGVASIALTSSTVSNNAASASGGGIYSSSSGTFNATSSTFDGNTAVTDGGAWYYGTALTVTLANSTFSNNKAGYRGGAGFFFSGGLLSATNSTFANNSAATVSTSTGRGGGAIAAYSAAVTLVQSTLTGNSAGTGQGGAINFYSTSTSPALTVTNSIIAGNTAATAPDIQRATTTAGTVTINGSVIGAADSIGTIVGSGNVTGKVSSPLDPQVLTLGNYGGPTQTVYLKTGSPAIDLDTTSTVAADQRGTARPYNTKFDAGAVEYTGGLPSAAVGTAANVTVASPGSYTFTVTYADDTSIDASSVQGKTNAVTVTGPTGANTLTVTGAVIDTNTNGTPRTVTYTVTPPANPTAGFDAADNGTYTITLNGNVAKNTGGLFVNGGQLATFKVAIAANYVVTTNSDVVNATDGVLSLREAVTASNASAGVLDTISFGGAFLTAADTITLSGGVLTLSDSVVVQGTGASSLTVSGGGTQQIFNVNGAGVLTVTVNGLTLTQGSPTASGSAVTVADESVTFAAVSITANTTTASGGGVYMSGAGVLTFTTSTITANTASSGGGVYASTGTVSFTGSSVTANSATTTSATAGGGGVYYGGTVPLTVTNSTFANNTATVNGGGVFIGATGATLNIVGSTLSGNLANGTSTLNGGGAVFAYNSGVSMTVTGSTLSGNGGTRGGAVYFYSASTATITNSTFSDNTAGAGGGGAIANYGGKLDLVFSTIARNSGGAGVGGIRNGNSAAITVTNSIIADNTSGSTSVDVGGAITANNSLIGSTAGATVSGAGNVVNVPSGLDPNGLAANGAAASVPLTIALLGGQAVNLAGSTTIPYDERGVGFPRVFAGVADAGAFESAVANPTAKFGTGPGVTPGAATASFTVVYTSGNAKVNVEGKNGLGGAKQIGTTDVTVTGPGGPVTVTGATASSATDASPVTVTYTVAAPGGTFDQADNGVYTIALNDNEVYDTNGLPIASATLTTFAIAIGQSFVVTNTLDNGTGSLRDAITAANASAGTIDTITFQAGLAGSIVLAGALPTITDGVIIDGTGTTVAVDGAATYRVLSAAGAAGNPIPVTLTHLTIQNGTGAGGAGISASSVNLTLSDVTVQNNVSSSNGGGISASASTLTVTASTIRGNSVTATFTNGGGIYTSGAGNVTLTRSTVSGNTSTRRGGGAFFYNTGTTLVQNATFSGNKADNTATGSSYWGGGGAAFASGTTTVEFSTFTANTGVRGTVTSTTTGGGGILAVSGSTSITNSIVSGNTENNGAPDLRRYGGTLTIANSVIGAANSFTYTDGGGNATGTAAAPLDALLLPLANYGGTTLTHYLKAGSPAVDLGAATSALVTDQRGPGYARVVGGKADAGAVERNGSIPGAAVGTAASVTVAGGTSYSFTVVYTDDTAVKAASVNGNTAAVTVTGPAGPFAITAAVASPNADGTPVTVTYTATPPGGTFDSTDSGQYTVSVVGGQVQNTGGVFAPAGPAGTFVVSIAGSYTVTNTNDTGAGSLRDALTKANSQGFTNDTITFQPGLTGTITLATALPAVTDSVSIDGAGATVTVDGASGYRSGLTVTDGTSRVLAVAVKNLTFQNGGAVANGAAFNLGGESLSLTNVVVLNNTATGSGAGIYTSGTSTLTLTDVTVTGNSIATTTLSYGGGLYVSAAASVTVTRGKFDGNTSNYYGGGVAVASSASTVAFDSVTFSGNTASSTGLGGALYLGGAGTYTVNGSTFSADTAGGSGGAVYQSSGALTVTDSTFSDNVASSATVSGSGGALALFGSATLNYTTVAGNTLSGSSTASGGGGISFGGTSLTITNSIVAGNTIGAGQVGVDVRRSAGTATVTASVVGVGSDFTFTGTGNASGTVVSPLDPQLEALAANGGPTQTRALKSNSPAINIGGSPTLTVDQRGQARNQGGAPDAGAFESAFNFPVAKLGSAANVTTAGGTTYSFTVVYSSGTAINVGTIDPTDVTVTGPNSFTATITSAVASPNTNGSPVTVTYTFAAPGGSFDGGDNGTYAVVLNNGAVQDTGTQSVQGGPLGSFTVAIPVVYVVTTGSDVVDANDGVLSLREAVTLANALPDADLITFNLPNPTTAQTITLGSEIAITQDVTIQGPANGAKILTLSGGGTNRIFNVGGTAALNVTLTDLAVTGGFSSDYGGAIRTKNDSLTLDRTWFYGNQAGSTATPPTLGGGGVVGTNVAGLNLTVRNSTFSGNVATAASSSYGGGAFLTFTSATVSIDNSTFVDNKATNGSGGVADFYAGGAGTQVTVRNSTFTGNSAGIDGGVFRTLSGGANATVVNSIFYGNSAVGSGPEFLLGTVTATNSDLGSTTGYTLAGSGNLFVDPQLGAFGYNGGSTQTREPLAGSPVIDAGVTTTLTTDQRGLVRSAGAGVDIGAVEVQSSDTVAPTASGTFGNVTTRKGATYQFAVTLADNVAVNASTVQGTDFTVTGPDGYSKTATLVSLSPAGNGSPLVATLTVPAPGGAFDVSDNGTYTVSVTGSITDTSGNAVKTGSLGTFAVQAPVAVQSVVTKLSDGTTTSLTTTGQRSVIPNIVVAYDGIATGANLAASYKLLNTSTNATVAVNVSTTTVGGKTVATVTPVAPLANAYYTFTAFGTAIATANVAPVVVGLDGDDNGTAGGNFVLDFHRFAGDVTGDTAVDGDDLAGLAAAFNSVEGDANYRAYLDLDGDGAVDGNDLAVFAQSFLLGIL